MSITEASTEWVVIQRGSLDWLDGWAALAQELRRLGYGDGADLSQHHDGNSWQLDGAYRGSDGVTLYEFRHRSHASKSGSSFKLTLAPASSTIPPDVQQAFDALSAEQQALELYSSGVQPQPEWRFVGLWIARQRQEV
jgi:hypothetical protein